MWLLDANLPLKLVGILNSYGINCDTAEALGWKTLGNGKLANAAHRAGFRCILTKDTGFANAAAGALKALPDLAIVLIKIPQMKEAAYFVAFQDFWKKAPIVPEAGKVVLWP